MIFSDFNHGSEQSYELFSPPSCILLLNGFPGVGKLSIAKALEIKLKQHDVPHRIIDSHLLIDPVIAIEPVRNTAHYALRKSFRNTAFEGLKNLKEEKLVIIFTAALSTSELSTPYDDIEQYNEYVDLAEASGIPLVMINIVCDLDTNRGRLCSEERKKGGKAKLVDVDVLDRVRRETSLLGQEQAMTCGKEGSIFYFELDTSELVIEQTTQKMWDFLCKLLV